MGPPPISLDEVISQMLELRKTLPKRPSLPELDVAGATITRIDEALVASQSELLRHSKPLDVPENVFAAFQEMRLEAAEHRAKEQKQVPKEIIELEERHLKYDKWIRKVHSALSSGPNVDAETDVDAGLETSTVIGESPVKNVDERDARGSARSVLDATWEFPPSEGSISSSVGVDGDGLKLINPKFSAHHRSDSFSRVSQSLSWNKEHAQPGRFAGEASTTNSPLSTPVVDSERIRDGSNVLAGSKFQKTAGAQNLLESSSVQKQTSLDLRGALLNDIECIPESIGKMMWLTKLNLSGNKLSRFPDSVGALVNLELMDLSLNQLLVLPETIGQFTCLKSLILDNNKIEELPYTIGECTSLTELRVSFNQLKALPEATGKLIELCNLDVHFNKLGSLPTTMASMASLVDLNASFNEINHVPEGLCQVISLTSLNLASNFNELRELPPNIGKLQKLKVLNISCNQLKILPDSFASLTNLQELDLSGNPLRVPPKNVAEQGTEAVLKYMADYVRDKGKERVAVKGRSKWASLLFLCAKPPVIDDDFIAQ